MQENQDKEPSTDEVRVNEYKKKSRWEAIFSVPVLRPDTKTSLLQNGYRVFFPGRCVKHPLLSSVEIKERLKIYLYSPSGPSWPVTT